MVLLCWRHLPRNSTSENVGESFLVGKIHTKEKGEVMTDGLARKVPHLKCAKTPAFCHFVDHVTLISHPSIIPLFVHHHCFRLYEFS